MPRRTTTSRGERRQSRRTRRSNHNTNSSSGTGSNRNSHRHRTHRHRNGVTSSSEPFPNMGNSAIRVSYNTRCFRHNRAEGPRDMAVISCEFYLPVSSSQSSLTICSPSGRVRNVSSRHSSNSNGRYHLRHREQPESNNLRAIVINPLSRSTQIALRARSESREGRRGRRSRDHSEPRESHSRPRRTTLRRRSNSHESRRRHRERPQREQRNSRVATRDARLPRERSNSAGSYDRLRRRLRGDRPVDRNTSPVVSLVRHPIDEVERILARQSSSATRHLTEDAGSTPHHRTRQRSLGSSPRSPHLTQTTQSRATHMDFNTSDSDIDFTALSDRLQARKRRRRGSNSNRRRPRVPFRPHVSSSSSADTGLFRGFNFVQERPSYTSVDSDSDISIDRIFPTGPMAMLAERFSDSSDLDVYRKSQILSVLLETHSPLGARSGRAAPEPMSPESVYRRDRLRGMFLNSPLMIYSTRRAGNASQGTENQQRRYDTDESHDSEPTSAGEHDTCAICLRTLRAELIANPSCCDHNFCPRCIQRWSETSSTCPVDRRRFMEIIVRNRRTGAQVDVLEAVHRNQFDFITEVFSNIHTPPLPNNICVECNAHIPDDDVITCNICRNTYHNACVYPPLPLMPRYWVCFTCASEHQSDFEDDEDDAEFVYGGYRSMYNHPPRSPVATRSSTRLQEFERSRSDNSTGTPQGESRHLRSPDIQEASDSSIASIEDVPVDYDFMFPDDMNRTLNLFEIPTTVPVVNRSYNRRPLSINNDVIHEKVGQQSFRQMEVVADGETAVMRRVDDLWRGEDVAVPDSEVSLGIPSIQRRVSSPKSTTRIFGIEVENAVLLMESFISMINTIKPNLRNSDVNCNEVPLFPTSKPSYDAKYSTLNRPTSENGNSGGYSSNASSLGSFNPSIRPGFSNILGNNTPADLTPFRGSSPIRFRMNPPRTAWRRQLNQQPVAPLTRPPTPPALLKSPGRDDDVNSYTDMPALLPPPALPALLLCSTTSSSDDDEITMPVIQTNRVPKRSEIYDPTEPNEDSTDDEVESVNKDYVPSYMTSPSYGGGNASYGPHLPMPEPPPVPSGIISLSTSEDEEEKNENFSCPNLHWYSSKTKEKSAPNPQLDIESIPLPEIKNCKKDNSDNSDNSEVQDDCIVESDQEDERIENGEEEDEKINRLRKFLIVGLGDNKRSDTIVEDIDSCVSDDADEEQVEKKSTPIEEDKDDALKENEKDEECSGEELVEENENTKEEEIPVLEKAEDVQSTEIDEVVDKTETLLSNEEDDAPDKNDDSLEKTSSSIDKVCPNTDDNMNDLEDKMITLDEVIETEKDEDAHDVNSMSNRNSESPVGNLEPSDNNEHKRKVEKKKRKKKKKKTDKNTLVKKSKRKKHNGVGVSLENEKRRKDGISWKRLTKNSKERNYRDGKEGKNIAELSGKKEIDNEKIKKKRKELERYNVRLVVNDNKKDEFGRDLTPCSSRSKSFKSRHSYSSRSKSPKLIKRRSRSRTKGSDKRRKSKERYNSDERVKSKSRVRSRERVLSRDRSKSKGRHRKRSNERTSSSDRRIREESSHKKDSTVRVESPRLKGKRKKMHKRSPSAGSYPLRPFCKSPKKKVNKRSSSLDSYQSRSLSRSPRKKIPKRSPSVDRYPLKSLSRSPKKKIPKRSPSVDRYPLRSLSRSPRKKMPKRSPSVDRYPMRSLSRSSRKKMPRRSPSVDRYPMRSLSRSPRKKMPRRSPSVDRYPMRSLSRSPRKKTSKRSPSVDRYPLRSSSRSSKKKTRKRSPSLGSYPLRSFSRSSESPPYYAKSRRSAPTSRVFPPQSDTLKNLTVVIPNDDLTKKKRSRRRKESRHKKKRRLPTAPHKAVFATGDNIVVSVNFSSKEKGVEYSKQVKRKRIGDEPRLTMEKKKKIPNVSKEILNAKPVAIIDLNSSPFREMQGQEVITLTDSGDEDEGTKTAPVEGSANDEKTKEMDFVAGPKTPPEPSSFAAASQVRPITVNSTFKPDDTDDSRKGPNTPPESSPEHASSPNTAAMYDPFEPTKSPQTPDPEVKGTLLPEQQSEIDMFAEETKEETTPDEDKDEDTPELVIDEQRRDEKKDNNDAILVAEERSPTPQAQTSNTLVIDLSNLGDNFVPKSSMPLIKTSQGKYEILGSNKSPDMPITVVISQQAQPVKPQPQQVVVTPTRQQIPLTSSSTQIPSLSKLLDSTRSIFSQQWAMPSTAASAVLSVAPFTSPEATAIDFEENDVDGSSPYSPASNEGDDIFEPPSESPHSQDESRILSDVLKPRQNDVFDLLKKTQKHDSFQMDRSSSTKLAAKVLPKAKVFALSPIPNTDIDLKQDEDQLKILDEVPNSAVELEVKEKFLKKLHRQERVVEEVKMALKPHYARKHISKEDYKFILKKAVPKICHNKSGDINPVKIHGLVEAYVKKIRHGKKKPHNSSSAFSTNTSGDNNPFKRAKSVWD